MDAEAKKEIDALKAALKAQSDGQAALIAQAVAAAVAARPMNEIDAARAVEVAAMRAKVTELQAKAKELSKDGNPAAPEGKALLYVIGNVPHYRDGVTYQPGEIIALPNDDAVRNRPSFTWSAYDRKAARPPSPAEVAEAKALSQIAKEQAPKQLGPLAPKKAARPSDTEV